MTEVVPLVTERQHQMEDRKGEYFNLSSAVLRDGRYWLAVRSEGAFHLREVRVEANGYLYTAAKKAHGVAHLPIHSSMTAEDIEGATYAHDDGTHWHFAHCSPSEQVDLAAEVRTFAESQFATAIARAQVKVDQAANAPAKADRVAKVSALVSFASLVGDLAYGVVVNATLGHWHRDPHNDHKRELTVAAIDSAEAAWAEAGKTNKAVQGDLSALRETNAHTDVKNRLGSTHTIEWRAARVARLEAERKAKEAAAEAETSSTESPGSGD